MTGAKTSACVRKPLTTFAMSLLLKYLGKIQDFGELYLRAKGLLLHYGGLPQMLSIEQSATYLALEDLRLVVLCTMFLKPSFKLFFQYTLNCPKESALMKLFVALRELRDFLKLVE